MDEFFIARVRAAATEEEAKAIYWSELRGAYHYDLLWLFHGTLVELYQEWERGPNPSTEWVDYIDEWRVNTRGVSWRAQLNAEFEAIDQGRIPETVGPQSWLLAAALRLERCDLVDALVAAGAPLDLECARMISFLYDKPEIIRAVLAPANGAETIKAEWLPLLLDSDVIEFTIPYLSGFSPETLKANCFRSDYETLHETIGVSFKDPEDILDALDDCSSMSFAPGKDVMRFLAREVDRTEEVLTKACKSIWYWVLFASEAEQEELIEAAPSLAKYLRRWFDPEYDDEDIGIKWTHKRLLELTRLPVGVAYTLLDESDYNDACAESVIPHSTLAESVARWTASSEEYGPDIDERWRSTFP